MPLSYLDHFLVPSTNKISIGPCILANPTKADDTHQNHRLRNRRNHLSVVFIVSTEATPMVLPTNNNHRRNAMSHVQPLIAFSQRAGQKNLNTPRQAHFWHFPPQHRTQMRGNRTMLIHGSVKTSPSSSGPISGYSRWEGGLGKPISSPWPTQEAFGSFRSLWIMSEAQG